MGVMVMVVMVMVVMVMGVKMTIEKRELIERVQYNKYVSFWSWILYTVTLV